VNIGKLLIYAGLGLAALGVLSIAASKLGIRFFRLPGDIVWKPTENSTIYLPIVTSIILSILLTLILSLFNRR
jgi:ABC-type Na+ efflux pump permease subunit